MGSSPVVSTITSTAGADRFGTPMLRLRAVRALARLWWEQGRPGPAHQMLREVHDRFTEGLATADLTDAAGLLDDLAATG